MVQSLLLINVSIIFTLMSFYYFSSDLCKKDILILLDTSISIGESNFNDKVKPFLKNLVQNPQLNVSPQGTQIAMITFSYTSKTKIRLNFGDKTSRSNVVKFIENLNWRTIFGRHTRTGLALQMAKDQVRICQLKVADHSLENVGVNLILTRTQIWKGESIKTQTC